MLSSYRLGNLVLLFLNYKEKLELLNDYPDSIGSEYILKNQYYKNIINIDLITEIVLKKIKNMNIYYRKILKTALFCI
jgi:hypothetical protein